MNKLPLLLGLIVLAVAFQAVLANGLVGDPATMMAVPLAALGFGIIVLACGKAASDPIRRRFLRRICCAAFIVRLSLGTTLLATGTLGFFGGDYTTYHAIGDTLANYWSGNGPDLPAATRARYIPGATAKGHGSRSGYYYFIAGLYFLFGSSLYVSMVVMSLLGSLSSLFVYLIAKDMFDERIGRWACALTAFWPSIVLWTCEGYKDGMIIFCLVVAYRCTQLLQEKLDLGPVVGLSAALWTIYQVRGYIFYVAIGPIILALTNRRTGDAKVFYNQLFGILILGIGLIASGLGNNLLSQMQEVNLKEVSAVRTGLALEANSGIEKDADISTPGKALAYLPTGVSYFLFAPFPWQMTKASQAVTAPEMAVWWALIPSVIKGIRRALKERMSESSGILIFLAVLTLVYGLSQGNVGTAYRVRAQLLVFYFIFAAAGMKENHWLSHFLPKVQTDDPTKAKAKPIRPLTVRS